MMVDWGRLRRKLLVAALLVLVLGTEAKAADLLFQFSNKVIHERGGRYGFKVGRFRISPFIYNEVRYDSNVFYQASEEGTLSATILRFLPGIKITNPDFNWVRLGFEGEADIQVYFSSNSSAKKQTNFGGGATLFVEFMPKRIFSVSLLNTFKRSIEPENVPGTSNLDRFYNRSGIQFKIRPGGRQMEIMLGYAFAVDIFDDYNDGSKFSHQAQLTYSWKFYPKTALIIDLKYHFDDYRRGFQVESQPVKAMIGVKGFFTKKVAAEIFLGYGNSLHKSGPKFNMFIGKGSVSFFFTPRMRLKIGVGYDVVESLYANYYEQISANISFKMTLFRRLFVEVMGQYSYNRYAEFDPSLANPSLNTQDLNRRDHSIVGQLKVTYDFLKWLGISAGYQVMVNQTDFQIQVTGPGTTSTDFGKYVKHEAYGSLNFKY